MTLSFVSLLCLLLAVHDVSGKDPNIEEGYESLYTSNSEEVVKECLNFTGKLPLWLNGTLVRVGPGKFFIGNLNKSSSVTNNLDGFAKLAMWKFLGNQSVLFTTKFLNSTYHRESTARNKFTSNIFLSQPVPPLNEAEKERSKEVGIDNMVITIVDFPNKENKTVNYVATNDVWSVYDISLDELTTIGKISPHVADSAYSLNTTWPKFIQQLSAAHPLPEPLTDNRISLLVNASLDPYGFNSLSVVRIKSLYETEIITTIQIPEVRLLHSFSVTQTKVAILMNPYILNVTCMVENNGNCYTYDIGSTTVTIYIVDLRYGNWTYVYLPKIYVYHHINAYDLNDDEFVVDVAAYEGPGPRDKLDLSKVMDASARKHINPKADMKRIHITISNRTATSASIPSPTPESVIASTLDYPVINEVNRSKPYCYVYGLVEKVDGVHLGSMGIAKKDVCQRDGCKSRDAIFHRVGWYPHEPVFVSQPYPTAEDDGVLLVPFNKGSDWRTHLAVLNATDLTLIDIADGVKWIPQSQHGSYFNR